MCKYLCGKLKLEVLSFWRRKGARPTCSCACPRQHRNPAGPRQHHCFRAITQARLKISYHWADVLALSPSTGGKSYYISPSGIRTVEPFSKDWICPFCLESTHTHTHTHTGVQDKACGSKQKWHPIHLSWSGSDVPHLILQGLALWNDIGLAPGKTNAVASITEAGSLYTAHTYTHTHTHLHTHTHTPTQTDTHTHTQWLSAVCLQLKTYYG